MSEKIPVFVGPSLPELARPADGAFDWRPPAAAGDILALIDNPPERLCLIDGFFDRCPAPWHKELLLLMARGTRIFGAASMGALRAAELDRFGMIGVGAIYRAYRDGRLTGDDEVALVHASARLDWAPLTVPMVEMRATLLAACRKRIITPRLARRIREVAHEIHFDSRDWPLIERRLAETEIADADTARRLRDLHVPLKRLDALECLSAARKSRGSTRHAKAPPWTCFIDQLASSMAARRGGGG
jgi:hypothetical protein